MGGAALDEPSGPRGVAVGWLAMVPLLAAYEVGVADTGPNGPRNFAELLLTRAPALLAGPESAWRLGLLIALSVVALVRVRQAQLPLGRLLLRAVIEGAVFALLLGPLLLIALAAFGLSSADLGLAAHMPETPAEFDRALRAFGAGAWEELAFRVGVYSAVYVVVRWLAARLGGAEALAARLGDAAAAVLSSLCFAACHLDVVMRALGLVGEPYDGRIFLWRALAGLFFAGLFRLRGVGVAAWSHGLFNLALILGAGPGVFR